MTLNARPANIGKSYQITNSDNGAILFLGDASSSRTSVKTIQFVPAQTGFTGDGFTVCARVYGPGPDSNGVPFNPIPYRRVQLAGAASDRTVVSAQLPATGFIIEVPLNGQTCAITVSALTGSGWLYSWDSVGSAT